MNTHELLKQAEEVQRRMKSELGVTYVEVAVGGGMVTVEMDGHRHLRKVRIEPDAADPEDPGMLEDLIVAAVNAASHKMDQTLREKLGMVLTSMPSVF
ncbi:MAG: YbaB/EbfC family nucleoid-associated protein [bacterium]|nr:YbaB/EbfC family nucleoid-associated protein [bacterium]